MCYGAVLWAPGGDLLPGFHHLYGICYLDNFLVNSFNCGVSALQLETRRQWICHPLLGKTVPLWVSPLTGSATGGKLSYLCILLLWMMDGNTDRRTKLGCSELTMAHNNLLHNFMTFWNRGNNKEMAMSTTSIWPLCAVCICHYLSYPISMHIISY